MSATANIAVLRPARGQRVRTERDSAERDRFGVRFAAFAALALYGTVRWASLLSPSPYSRLLGLFALGLVLAGAGGAVARSGLSARQRRAIVLVLAATACVAVFAIAGVPLSWVRHVRIALTARGIGNGLAGLPRALVPYNGVNEWVRVVIVLGAAVLMIDAALMLALAPRNPSDARRAAIALPLVALAVVPSTLNRPAISYGQGLLLFVLLAAFMWGDRLRAETAALGVSLIGAGAAVAMIAAPALDQHRPWLNYQALAGTLAPAHPETFDWSQRYGPLHWPRNGHEVFDVQAPQADYWKTENLDAFDGRGWVASTTQLPDPGPTVDPATLQAWTQTLHVTLRAIRTNDVIAAGSAQEPQHAGNAIAGVSNGTWTVPTGLGPGDSYTVRAYSPHPTATQLESAGTQYPPSLAPDLTVAVAPSAPGPAPAVPGALAPTPVPGPPEPVSVPHFGLHDRGAAEDINGSVYAPAYAIAQRLLRRPITPYDYVMAVKAYLGRGFRYDEHPPASAFPLETFLTSTRRGYCQQFAGAMALLLRFGGVPARVATGFTPGTRDNASHAWVVSDIDAHAWVEAWFPHYGWVRFDPTPGQDPARGGNVPLPAIQGGENATGPAGLSHHGLGPVKTQAAGRRRVGQSTSSAPVAALVVLGVLVLLLLVASVRVHEPTEEQRLTELERALRRCGRPLTHETTLAAVERWLGTGSEAQEYVRTLRLARFAGLRSQPTPAQRRALRTQLRSGLGLRGRLRSIWALPPRITLRRGASSAPAQRLNST